MLFFQGMRGIRISSTFPLECRDNFCQKYAVLATLLTQGNIIFVHRYRECDVAGFICLHLFPVYRTSTQVHTTSSISGSSLPICHIQIARVVPRLRSACWMAKLIEIGDGEITSTSRMLSARVTNAFTQVYLSFWPELSLWHGGDGKILNEEKLLIWREYDFSWVCRCI